MAKKKIVLAAFEVLYDEVMAAVSSPTPEHLAYLKARAEILRLAVVKKPPKP